MLCGMASNNLGTPKAKGFGSVIREIRKAGGEERTLRAVAKELGMDPSRLSKIETGKAVPKEQLAKQILDHLGVPDEQQPEMLKLLEGAETEQPWRANTLPEQRQHITAIVEFEDVAEEIVECTLTVIPGLLQTKAYARAVMS